MNIFKTIFINSIPYKIIEFCLFLYANSYFKKCVDYIVHIYKNSNLCRKIENYFNSTPIYKYSIIKKINENIYYFIVNKSGFIYNFVAKNIENSTFCAFIKNESEKTKKDTLKMVSFFGANFFLAFTISKNILTYGQSDIIIFSLVGCFFALVFVFSDFLTKVFLNSMCYKICTKILEVPDEK